MSRTSQCSRCILSGFLLVFVQANAGAVAKPHVITFGKWTTVQGTSAVLGDDQPLTLKIRPVLVDGRVKEFSFGAVHDVTDRIFVIQRAFRVNDSLPQESSPTRWQWQKGGWLLVDRVTGRISPLNLPQFDADFSIVSWYRDYAAYCGVSDDGRQIYAVVAQLGRRKPVIKWQVQLPQEETKTEDAQIEKTKPVSEAGPKLQPGSACALPNWQRNPARITFEGDPSAKRTYLIRSHTVDLLPEDDDEDEATR